MTLLKVLENSVYTNMPELHTAEWEDRDTIKNHLNGFSKSIQKNMLERISFYEDRCHAASPCLILLCPFGSFISLICSRGESFYDVTFIGHAKVTDARRLKPFAKSHRRDNSSFDYFVHGLSFYQERAKPTSEENTLEVDTILYSSWGYDQVNITFYQVLKVTPKQVTIQEIGREALENDMHGHCVPLVGEFKGEPIRRRMRNDGYVRINDYESASRLKYSVIAGVKVYDPKAFTTYA